MPDMYLKSKLDAVFKYMQGLSIEASIVSKFVEIEVPAPIRRGIARVEFVDKPKSRYLVVAVPVRIMIEVTGSEAVLPYIDLKVEDNVLSGVHVPALSDDGYYIADPVAGIALISSIMQTSRYVIKSKSVKLKKFIESIFEDVRRLELEFRDKVEFLMEEVAKQKEPAVDVEISISLNKEGTLTLYYKATGRTPFIVISVDYSVSRDEAYIIPVMSYNGRDVAVVRGSGYLSERAIELLNMLDIDTLFKEVRKVLHQFTKEYAKALIVAKMWML